MAQLVNRRSWLWTQGSMRAEHSLISLYLITGTPTLIRNTKGHLVTLPSHPLCWDTPWRWFIPTSALLLDQAEPREVPVEQKKAQEPRAQLKVWTYLFSERGPLLYIVNVFCSTSNPTHPQSLSVWISISSLQPSKIPPGPPVARILRHSGNVVLDGYMPTPNRSLRQRWPTEQFTLRVIRHLCLPLCKRQDIHKGAGNFLLIYRPLTARGNKGHQLALKPGTDYACL